MDMTIDGDERKKVNIDQPEAVSDHHARLCCDSCAESPPFSLAVAEDCIVEKNPRHKQDAQQRSPCYVEIVKFFAGLYAPGEFVAQDLVSLLD